MNNWVEVIMMLVLITNLILLASSRLPVFIELVALQSILLGFLPTLLHESGIGRIVFWVIVGTGLKGILLPFILLYVLHSIKLHREIEPFVGYGYSVFIGVLVIVFSFWFSANLSNVPHAGPPLMMPTAVSTIFIGLFVVISRKKAFSQVLGYLTFENGISIMGLTLVGDVPILVELGIALDIFVAVLIMGIAVYSINRQFGHVNTDELHQLDEAHTLKE